MGFGHVVSIAKIKICSYWMTELGTIPSGLSLNDKVKIGILKIIIEDFSQIKIMRDKLKFENTV